MVPRPITTARRISRVAFAMLAVMSMAALVGTGLGVLGPQADAQAPAESRASVVLLTVQEAIGPATSDFIRRGIDIAAENEAELVVLQLDTPGGLDSSMRDIIQAILASPVPVATYVYPQGARAASAGTYILMASHIAAMAPATTTGAATPVSIGGGSNPFAPPPTNDSSDDGSGNGQDEDAGETPPPPPEPATASERKAINDAVSYIRGLAEQHGRNADWAERAVRSADSISAQVALDLGVIDVIASDLDDLMRQIDGRVVVAAGQTVTLATGNVSFERIERDWRTRLLSVITNPEVAYILLLIGIYGLLFEGYNPGAVLPGVVGAIALLLALFAFQLLPVNYAGLALVILGVVLMIAEFFVPSFGALGFGGIAAFVFGSLILVDTEVPGFERPTALITSLALLAGAGLLAMIWLAMRARARPVVSGAEEMTHLLAEALDDFDGEGTVWAHSERWRAHSSVPIRKGQQLKIAKVDGLLLEVEPLGPNTPTGERS